jgi:uncharacterized protein
MIAQPLQWICAVLGAFMVGVSKAGLTGISILSVALFTHVFPSSKQASGLVLPLLIFGDCVAVIAYRAHAQWRYVAKLMPWTAVGVVLGYLALGRISDGLTRIMIGIIIVGLCALSYWRRYRRAPAPDAGIPSHWAIGAVLGIAAGFITLVANAAGPLMAIYFVAMRLPKMAFMGTTAVFFMVLNLFKVPFMVALGLITVPSFEFNLMLAPAVLLGAFTGRWILLHINQELFEKVVLALSAVGGIFLIA